MKITHRILLLILITSSVITVTHFFLARHQEKALHRDSEKILAGSLVQSLSDTLVQDVIDGNKLRVTHVLRNLVRHDNPLEFIYIEERGHRVFAHSFQQGFPRYLLHQSKHHPDRTHLRLANKYQTKNGLIFEYVRPLIPGLDIYLRLGINQSQIDAKLTENTHDTLLTGSMVIMLSLLFAYMLARRITRPLNRFAELIHRYGEGEKISLDDIDHSDREIKKLSEIFHTAIEERTQAQEIMLHQANFDALTELPNRFLTLDRLTLLINEARRDRSMVAVMFLDLDDFKKINDTLGHAFGDELLIEAAERLRGEVRSADTVGRLGGDEFIILLGGLRKALDAQPVAENMLSCFREAFNIQGRELLITASIGITIYPDDGDTASELLRNADTAMYHSKDLGRNSYSYYTDEMNQDVSRRLALEEQMSNALEKDEFHVNYQAKVDIGSRKIVGFEALLRWKNSLLGNIHPEEFIKIAEQSGLIIPIGKFVLSEAISVIAHLREHCGHHLSIAVNLSPRQFRDPHLATFIEETIKHYEIDAKNLELEITENVLLSGYTAIEDTLDLIKSLGVSIAMDDFGTGYSSLNYLRNYPFNVLKIDKTFIKDMVTDMADRELVNASIAMAHGLGLKVVAEGVETEEQMAILNAQGCDIAQGYLFSKAISPSDLMNLLKCVKTTQ